MRRLILTIGALSLLACGGDSSTGPIASAVGTWQLQTINGSGMPYTVLFQASPPYRLEIVSDVFVANANGTFTETLAIRETDGSTVTNQTDVYNGTWTQDNGAITIRDADGTVSSGAITGNTITANVDGDVFVYRRQ